MGPFDPVCVAMQMLHAEQSETERYEVEIEGKSYFVNPGVFSPKYRGNSRYFIEVVPQYVVGRYLGMGAGAGILETRLAEAGYDVVATDISGSACANCRLNAYYHGVKMEVYRGDLFERVPAMPRFDTIFWNHPWLYVEKPLADATLKVSFDQHYQDLTRFFKEAPIYLSAQGSILLGTGSPAQQEMIKAIAGMFDFEGEELCRNTIPLMVGGELYIDVMVYRYHRR